MLKCEIIIHNFNECSLLKSLNKIIIKSRFLNVLYFLKNSFIAGEKKFVKHCFYLEKCFCTLHLQENAKIIMKKY